ncbi:MAG: CRISPR-associated endoribonuclease Cas6 [Chitinophagaceae bacterium]
MRFVLTFFTQNGSGILPLNYAYPLSAALYKILSRGDARYASFLHEKGYGKGFKFFTFSQLNVPFKIEGDRMRLLGGEAHLQVGFHLPVAAQNFVKGLFQSQTIEIADKKSKASFVVKSVASLANPLQQYKDNELVSLRLKPLSPVVAGMKNERGNYDFLHPDDARFAESLIYNWRSKIESCYDKATAESALLMAEIIPMQKPFKSRLITIKKETKIRGWMNFGLRVTAEKYFVELLLNAGAGIENSQGFGCVEVVTDAKEKNQYSN